MTVAVMVLALIERWEDASFGRAEFRIFLIMNAAFEALAETRVSFYFLEDVRFSWQNDFFANLLLHRVASTAASGS